MITTNKLVSVRLLCLFAIFTSYCCNVSIALTNAERIQIRQKQIELAESENFNIRFFDRKNSHMTSIRSLPKSIAKTTIRSASAAIVVAKTLKPYYGLKPNEELLYIGQKNEGNTTKYLFRQVYNGIESDQFFEIWVTSHSHLIQYLKGSLVSFGSYSEENSYTADEALVTVISEIATKKIGDGLSLKTGEHQVLPFYIVKPDGLEYWWQIKIAHQNKEKQHELFFVDTTGLVHCVTVISSHFGKSSQCH